MSRFLLLTSLPLALAGCQAILHVNDEDAQQIVNAKALGSSSGEFFERYGRPVARAESKDGIRTFVWEGGVEHTAAGVRGIEDQICRLQIVTDKAGRIASAVIVRDAKGTRRLTRCSELFDR